MNYYVGVINEAVDYIEDSITERLSLGEVSHRFGISDFHFNRMFKIVTGITLKQYILGRKLTKAMAMLKETDDSIIDVALELGFECPEVFSRAFKKQFGISPARFRDSNTVFEGVTRACIVERDIVNYRGGLVLKGNRLFMEEFSLWGVFIEANVNHNDFKGKLKSRAEAFLTASAQIPAMVQEQFFTVVNCHGEDNGEYTVFCGRKLNHGLTVDTFQERIVTGGWYMGFNYEGDMYDIRESFIDDLYRWIMVKEAELNPNGIGMINIYQNNYPASSGVRILVPVKKPV